MQATFVYSGTFDPPTYGHFTLLMEATKVFPQVIIVCSDHSHKNPKFSQEERVALWQSYDLPSSVTVQTFDQFLDCQIPGENIILIRGIRDKQDIQHETRVFLDTAKNASITKAFYILATGPYRYISSSKVWELAREENWEALEKIVTKKIATEVAKKKPLL